MPERPTVQLDRYLLSGEQIVVATHRHWATLAEPVLTVVVGLVLVTALGLDADARLGQFVDFLWWLWFALVGRALFYLYEWRREWFIATDRRLLLIYGFVIRKVDMMPLSKVTDMTYHRTVVGRLLGYGTFVLESAGQDQALSKVDYIPHPDQTYTAIIAQIFHRDGDRSVETENAAAAVEIDREDDPTRRSALSQRLARFVPGRRERDEHGVPQGHDIDPDDPDTESLWTAGSDGGGVRRAPRDHTPRDHEETIYHSGTEEGPVQRHRGDTTGWWSR